ncbi:MAG TPA: type II toxin-antitoxin system VapC family toxin [Ktedonobacterales bacterium]|nr:type II toxin-antitoxin system VapC family toxin [Ktedonobacterales bacterium]
MGTYFLDTSALVKRYVTEVGQDWVNRLFQRDAGNTLIISQATLAEAVAAFCAKARASDISETERDRIIALFRGEARRLCRLERVTTAIYTFAGDLCRMHRLRAYDAVQLACAITVRDKLTSLGVTPTFVTAVTADRELLSVASLEGLLTDDPNIHP